MIEGGRKGRVRRAPIGRSTGCCTETNLTVNFILKKKRIQRCVKANITAKGVTSGCPRVGVVESRQKEAENCFIINNPFGKMRPFKPHG